MPVREPNRPRGQTLEAAVSYMQGFLRNNPQYSPNKLFERRMPLNPCALALLRYCSNKKLQVAGAHAVFASLTLPARLLGSRGNPASWLWHMGNNVPRVTIDKACVHEMAPMTERNKIFTRCLVHEIGHIVCHWYDLLSRPSFSPTRAGKGWIAPSTPAEEEEAWLYCGCTVGLALGWCARELREAGVNDEMYIHS